MWPRTSFLKVSWIYGSVKLLFNWKKVTRLEDMETRQGFLVVDGEFGVGETGCFDDRQRCYVSVIKSGDTYRCWFTGNGFGETGMGYAEGTVADDR